MRKSRYHTTCRVCHINLTIDEDHKLGLCTLCLVDGDRIDHFVHVLVIRETIPSIQIVRGSDEAHE